MDHQKKILALKRILEKANDVTIEDTSNTTFIVWKNLTYRTLEKIFGPESTELKQFDNLDFSYKPMIRYLDQDYSSENLKSFKNDFSVAIESIKSYKHELELDNLDFATQNPDSTHKVSEPKIDKIFISHSSADKEIVEELIELLEGLGLSSQIFCSSIPEYGITLGENFLERLKYELGNNVLVLFILSENFYKSPVCLCEMGATWMKTNEHIPVLVPPLDFNNIKGVIPLTQGFRINDRLSLNQFKEKVQQLFTLGDTNSSTWERKRDRFLKNINDKLNSKTV